MGGEAKLLLKPDPVALVLSIKSRVLNGVHLRASTRPQDRALTNSRTQCNRFSFGVFIEKLLNSKFGKH